MVNILNYLDKNKACSQIHEKDLIEADIIISVKLNLMGIKLKDFFLILNCTYFYSFRLKIENVSGLHSFALYKCKSSINKDYLERYFSENQDNPYGLMNVMTSIRKGEELTNLTQFPPLYFPKNEKTQREGIKKMHEIAKLGDIICTYDRKSGTSRLIRKYDKGMWSHVAIIDKNRKLFEVTTEGVINSDFFRLCKPDLDVALYRVKSSFKVIPEEIQKNIDEMLMNRAGYNWIGVFFAFLYRRFNIRLSFLRKSTYFTPAVMMNANVLELVYYC